MATTLRELLARYIDSRSSLSAASARRYRNTVDRFSTYLGREATVDDLNGATVAEFTRANLPGMSPRQALLHQLSLHALWNWHSRQPTCC